ncbi:MAG: hypothetical protein ACHBN1_08485 [Heteroscytonema crispum UTEX LB 1556]
MSFEWFVKINTKRFHENSDREPLPPSLAFQIKQNPASYIQSATPIFEFYL